MSSAEQEASSVVATQPSPERLGHGVLTTADCIAQSLAIGPIFSTAFVAFLIAGTAAGAAPVAVIIGAVGVLALGYVVSLYARRYRGAGAIYDYLRQINPILGIFSAGMYFIGTLVLASGGFLVLGLLISQVLGQYVNMPLPWWLGSVICLAVIFAVNHFGVKLATRFQLIFTSISIIPLLLLAIIIIVKGGDAGNTLQAFNPASVPSAGIFAGILFAILLFVGFETSASLGEETADPQKSIPRAVIGSVLVAMVFFLIMVYACDIGYGLAHTDKWATDSLALDTLANRYVGKWLAVLIDIAVFFDALAVMSAFTATTARGWFAIARAGLLPRSLATQSRHRTPLGGNLVVLAVSLIILIGTVLSQLGLASATAQGNVLTQFSIMSTIGSLLIEAIYIFLAVVAIRFVREKSSWWRWIVLVVAIVTPLLGIYGSVVPFPPYPNSLAVYIAAAGIVVAGIWTFFLTRTRSEQVEQAREPYSWEGDSKEPALY
jgi:amino acid transporter